jgi:hypothetical protein
MIASFMVVVFAFAFAGCHKKAKNGMNMQDTTSTGMMSNRNMRNNNNMRGKVTAQNSGFSATLTGNSEVPKIKTQASGNVYFKLNKDSTKLKYTLKVSDAKNVTMAHIHMGVSGKNGPIVVWLYPGPRHHKPNLKKGTTNGVLKSGTITKRNLVGPMKGKTIKDLVNAIKNDSTYVNVHNKMHPKGFIRGNLSAGGNAGMGNNNSY